MFTHHNIGIWSLHFSFILIQYSFLASLCFEEKKGRLLWYPWRRHHKSYFPKTVTHIQMKLGTHVPKTNIHGYTESHKSDFNNYSEMPLFGLHEETDKRWHSLLSALVCQTCTKSFEKSSFEFYFKLSLFHCSKEFDIIRVDCIHSRNSPVSWLTL